MVAEAVSLEPIEMVLSTMYLIWHFEMVCNIYRRSVICSEQWESPSEVLRATFCLHGSVITSHTVCRKAGVAKFEPGT